jgi:hypothetical protein
MAPAIVKAIVAEDPAGFTEPRGVEGLEPLVDQGADGRAALGPVVPDRLAFEKRLGTFGSARGTVWHHL